MAIRIAIIEDSFEVRESFSVIINSIDEYKVVGAYDCCEDAMRELKKSRPDVILMDITLPGMDGITGTREIRKIDPNIDIVIISVHENSDLVFRALCNGAIGYLTKSADLREIIDALEELRAGGAPMSTKIARMVAQSFQSKLESPLTKRETQILQLVANGHSYYEISASLNISVETTKSHITNIYRKLEVKNKVEAINFAKRGNII